MGKVIIYHNPNCGTSRNVLAIIRHTGIEPQVIEYLQNPPSREKLLDLVAAMGISFQELVRKNVPEYNQHGLDKEAVTEDEILDAMMEDPILINRPIVVTRKGTKLCRPSEALLEILPVPLPSPYTKEDGEVVNPL